MLKGKYTEKNRGFLEIAQPLDAIARKLLVPLLFLVVCTSYFLGIPYPLIPLLIIFLMFSVINGTYFRAMRQGLFPAETLYFLIMLSDAVLLAFAIYYTGGPESFAPVLFIVIGVLAGLNLSFSKFFLVIITCTISYLTELALEASSLIPHISIYNEFLAAEIYTQSSYLRVIPLAYIVVFVSITFISYSVAESLKKDRARLRSLNQELDNNSKLLDEKYHEVEELKNSLEDKVRKRTSELEAARKNLKEDMVKLQAVDRLKTEFLSMVSHELRTPITPLKGYLSFLLSNRFGKINIKQRKALSVLNRQSDHLEDLIESLLDISRLELGKPLPIQMHPLSLDQLIRKVNENIKINVKGRGIALKLDIKTKLPSIIGDEIRLKRVLANLIGNALKFTSKGGSITIRAKPDKKNIRIEIVDNGIGIEGQYLGKIFEKFFQIDSSYTRAAGGLGMGLAISKELIEVHGGKIWAESKGLGKGTTLIITLPVTETKGKK